MLRTLPLGIIALAACSPAYAWSPEVVLGDIGKVVGITNSTLGLDTFLGIPYAQPPVGTLRWRVPVPLSPKPSRVIQATAWGPACIQGPVVGQFPPGVDKTSEDCLSINIFRPAGLKDTAKLPVMVWIYGGAFTQGASQQFDPTFLIQKSVQLREPIIYVSMNYRLNSFGFLASDELLSAQKKGSGTSNAGLHDIQAALLWVQKYIDKFGGDHNKVTVFGVSAGANAIGSLLVADHGKAVQHLKLFRAAIMESGATSGDGAPAPSYLGGHYRDLAKLVGCGHTLSNRTSLECLRGVSTEALTNASISMLTGYNFPFNRVQDGYFHDALPSTQVRRGGLANVPILTGTNLDEGTLAASTTLNSTSDLVNFFTRLWYDADASPAFNARMIPKLLQAYPDDPTVGSPYAPINTSASDRFYGPKNQYKRAASIFGDQFINSGRRLLLDAYNKKDDHYPAYNYLFTENTPGSPPVLGVFHTSEVAFVYAQYAAMAPNTTVGVVSNYMASAWIAFANNLNPNRPHLPKWPQYGRGRATLQIGTDASDGSFTKVIKDNFREKQIAFFESGAWSKEINV